MERSSELITKEEADAEFEQALEQQITFHKELKSHPSFECNELCSKPSIANVFFCKTCPFNKTNFRHMYTLFRFNSYYRELVHISCRECFKQLHYHNKRFDLDDFQINLLVDLSNPTFQIIDNEQRYFCHGHTFPRSVKLQVRQKCEVSTETGQVYSKIKISCPKCKKIYYRFTNGIKEFPEDDFLHGRLSYKFGYDLF